MRYHNTLLLLVVTQSLVKLFDLFAHQNFTLKLSKPTAHNARENVPYSDGIELDSVRFPEDNDPIIPEGTVVFKKHVTDQWINAQLNLPQGNLPVEFPDDKIK